MEKLGKFTVGIMVAWFLIVAGLGIVISLMNGTLF